MSENFEPIQNPPLDEVLLHYGILGMHWGIRRYQNPDGSLTPAGLARAKKATLRKEKIQEARAKRKAKKERKVEEKIQKRRNKILNDPDLLYKHLEEFSYQEIENALKFYDQRKRLNDARRVKMGQAKNYVDTVLRYGDTVNSAVNFLNSDVGRGIRGKLGMSTNKWFDFSERDYMEKRRMQYRADRLYPKPKKQKKDKDDDDDD